MKEEIQTQVDNMKEELAVDFIGLALSDNSVSIHREIRWQFVSGNISEQYKKIILLPGRGIAGIVWRTGRKLVAENRKEQASNSSNFPIMNLENLHSLVTVPIYQEKKVLGVLLVAYRKEVSFDDLFIKRVEDKAESLISFLKESENDK